MSKQRSKLQCIKERYPRYRLTKEDMKDLTVEMWNEIAENMYDIKRQSKIIQWFNPFMACFACSFYSCCSSCVFSSWYEGGCVGENSPYTSWRDSSGYAARQHAIEIADLFID